MQQVSPHQGMQTEQHFELTAQPSVYHWLGQSNTVEEGIVGMLFGAPKVRLLI